MEWKRRNDIKRLCWFLFFGSWIGPSYMAAGISLAFITMRIIDNFGFFHWRSLFVTYAFIVFVFHKIILKHYPENKQ